MNAGSLNTSSFINHTLLIGLGNPGAKYANNRHNFGFMAIDEIARILKAPEWSEKFGGLVTRVGDLFLFKPMSFMNNSGIPVTKIVNFYKISLEQIYIFYDELDLPLGKIKIKQGGGDGGHNGVKSLDAYLGKDYWRVRLGIGHPGDKDLVLGHVLGDFTVEEKMLVKKAIYAIADNAHLLIENTNLFLTKYPKVINDN